MKHFDGLKSAVSAEDWGKIGTKLYGSDKRNWKFKCPNCGYIQTFNDFLKFVSEEEARGLIGFSCIGRVMPNCKGTINNKEKPCNYTLGGLFNFAKFWIIWNVRATPFAQILYGGALVISWSWKNILPEVTR